MLPPEERARLAIDRAYWTVQKALEINRRARLAYLRSRQMRQQIALRRGATLDDLVRPSEPYRDSPPAPPTR